MKLNHLDLQVSDIHAARSFFETHFGLQCDYTRRNEMAILDDGAGFSLGLSNLTNQTSAPLYPHDFHVGFVLEEAAQVEELYARLQHAGVPMKRELSDGGPNVYFMCAGPEGIPVEVRAPRG